MQKWECFFLYVIVNIDFIVALIVTHAYKYKLEKKSNKNNYRNQTLRKSFFLLGKRRPSTAFLSMDI